MYIVEVGSLYDYSLIEGMPLLKILKINMLIRYLSLASISKAYFIIKAFEIFINFPQR